MFFVNICETKLMKGIARLPMKVHSFLLRIVLFSFVLTQISCDLHRAGQSANLMDDGIYYDPDVEWIDLYAEEESEPIDQEEEGFDYYDPQDANDFFGMGVSGTPWNSFGSIGMCDPFGFSGYSPFDMYGWGSSMGYGMGFGVPFYGYGTFPYSYPYYGYNPYYNGPWNDPFDGGGFYRSGVAVRGVRPDRTRSASDPLTDRSGKQQVYREYVRLRSSETSVESSSSRSTGYVASYSDREESERLRIRKAMDEQSFEEPNDRNSASNSQRSSRSGRQLERDENFRGRPAVRIPSSGRSGREGQTSSKGWKGIRLLEPLGSGERSNPSKENGRPARRVQDENNYTPSDRSGNSTGSGRSRPSSGSSGRRSNSPSRSGSSRRR
jgi:hypothetical protein